MPMIDSLSRLAADREARPVPEAMRSSLISCSPVITWFLIGLMACLGVCGVEAQSTDSDPRPPNIVFILADDLGWGDISIHGGKIPTPNIDRLFEQGVEISNFMGWPVCSPTRAMFLTGRHPFRLGLGPKTGGELDTEETTIAEAFSAQGYRTGVFGKWHNGAAPDTPEFREAHAQAFGHKPNKVFLAGPGANAHGFDEAWVYYQGAGDHFTRAPLNSTGPVSWWHNEEYRPDDEGYTDDLITQRALNFIRDNRDRPFFGYVSFHIVHAPLQAKAEDIVRVPAAITDEKQRLYGAMLIAMDDNVRQLLEELDRLGLEDDTIVVFTSDNGASRTGSNRPFRGNKGSLYDGGIRMPTAIRWPRGGLVGGQVWDGLCGFLDLFPTLIDMAGLPMPDTRPLDGKNVWPAIRDRGVSPVESSYWAWRRKDVIRTAEWKLHRFFNRDELFDIRQDPGEQRNIADERPEVVADLKEMMNAWASSTGAALTHRAPPPRLDSNPAPDGEVLKISVTVTERGKREEILVVPIANFAGRRAATDFIEFDVCTARGSLTNGFFYTPFRKKGGVFKLEFRPGSGVDQFGRAQSVGPAPRHGREVWEHRVVGLLGESPGPLSNHAIVFRKKRAGKFEVYFDNLRIRHADGSTTPIWEDGADTRFSLPSDAPNGFSEVDVQTVQLADLNTKISVPFRERAPRPSGNRSWNPARTLLVVVLGALAVAIAYRTFKKR
jgi:arylsulfatase A-like enzyme